LEPDSFEANLSLEELKAARVDIWIRSLRGHVDLALGITGLVSAGIAPARLTYPYADGDQFTPWDANLEDIEVPLLSVANWGETTLHLRGNVEGFARGF
jgi:hypothetical protein